MSETINKQKLLETAKELSEKHSALKSTVMGILEQTESTINKLLEEIKAIEHEYSKIVETIKNN